MLLGLLLKTDERTGVFVPRGQLRSELKFLMRGYQGSWFLGCSLGVGFSGFQAALCNSSRSRGSH